MTTDPDAVNTEDIPFYDREPIWLEHPGKNYAEYEPYREQPLLIEMFNLVLGSLFYGEEHDRYVRSHGYTYHDPMREDRIDKRTINRDFSMAGAEKMEEPDYLKLEAGIPLDQAELPAHIRAVLETGRVSAPETVGLDAANAMNIRAEFGGAAIEAAEVQTAELERAQPIAAPTPI